MSRVDEMCWRWELTPAELFAGFKPIQSKPAREMSLEVRSFTMAKKPLAGTPYLYQFAVTDWTADSPRPCLTTDILRIREAQPDLPVSGDRRSGVLVFDDDLLIGSCVIPGKQPQQGYRMVVHPKYQQQGLAYRMLLEWCRETKRARELPDQGITLASSKALLRVHKELIEWALQEGKEVPEHVVRATRDGKEAQHIIERLERVETLTNPKRSSEASWQL